MKPTRRRSGNRVKKTASRAATPSREVRPFIVMEVLERALTLERSGRSIIHLEIGEPGFPTPPLIVRAAVEALEKGDTHYTDSRGIAELRSAIALHYGRRYGASVSEERVIVTMGTSPAMLLVLSLLIEEPGDEVIIGDPGYPCYPNFIRYLRGVPRPVAAREREGFQLKPEAVRKAIGPRTRAVIVNSPSNPAGTLIPRDDLAGICGLGIPVISDEIYHGLVYEDTEHSASEFTDDAFILNGFSKLFAMTGWRLGYAIAPAKYLRRLQILQQNFFISPNSFVQRGGIAALAEEHPEIEEMRRQYAARRRYLREALPQLGLQFAVEPKGAFYFFVNTNHIDPNSYRLAFDLLDGAGVAVAPGVDFGEHGEGHVRISYASSLESIVEGMRRLAIYLERKIK
ncbi:MAG TPA: pyridoxal phosphate-dependent aminotransferase [Candidatus Bathyarchaeia archaeon]|nr:pyridoxal phosphate-dependent aminotransferase [Candidatus Bathyarchaeia archaeon]